MDVWVVFSFINFNGTIVHIFVHALLANVCILFFLLCCSLLIFSYLLLYNKPPPNLVP